MLPSSFDTSPEAYAVQLSAWRRMGPQRRLLLAMQMSDEIRQVTLAGIRHRHPEYTEEEARFALFRQLLGHELFVRAWPHAPVLAP
jgi:hypothetical protein